MAHKHIVYMMLVEAAAQLPDRDALPRYAALLEELAAQDNHQPYLAVAHRAWGIHYRLNNEFTEAEERLSQALTLFEDLEAPWQIGRTLFEFAQLAQARADKESSQKYYSQALKNFETLKAVSDIARTQAGLEGLG